MKKQLLLVAKVAAIIFLATACTKTRKAELSEDLQASVFAISDFGTPSESSQYKAQVSAEASENALSPFSVQAENRPLLRSSEVSVPEKMKFMFDNMPLANLQAREFKVTFSVDREFVTAYKVAPDISKLSVVEKLIAVTPKELEANARLAKAAPGQVASLTASAAAASTEKENIKNGRAQGALLIPLFKYKVESYGTVVRSKNELKEETSRLELKSTDWKDATHVQISSQSDSRLMVGMGVEDVQAMRRIFSADRLDNQTMTAEELQNNLSVGMRFVEPQARVFTRLDASVMHVYQISRMNDLTESQRRLLTNNAGNQEILSCKDEAVAQFFASAEADCVLILRADVPISYRRAKLADGGISGTSTQRVEFEEVQRVNSAGLIQIDENVAARQVVASGVLDPNSTIKLSDIQGEFFYRRTFESASNMFMGRTGTSGDMAIVKFELEDRRIVVRNQDSLIKYTGQGPRDREELMSFPVRYFKMERTDARGSVLTVPQMKEVTKEQAEYALIDWTNNTVPDSTSPLAFYAGGDCFMANSSLSVTDTDMRLATDGVLNYSLSGSYTVKPSLECIAQKDVNSAYWAGSMQFNFNVKERISFLKHTDKDHDVQFAPNMSSMAQSAFNFGVFTLADLVTGNGVLTNREGSEKYMPIIHDFRNGKVLTYHLGGINNPEATSPERRQLLVESAQQVIAEWNATLKLAFRGTELAREGDYVKLVVDEPGKEGHLGDLDRNYIWFNELPAENGLLGVAQPAANPRSGTIKSANVIVYTGNTFDQSERLLTMNKVFREYEHTIEKLKTELVAQVMAERKAAEENDLNALLRTLTPVPQGAPAGASPEMVNRMHNQIGRTSVWADATIKALHLDNKRIQSALNGYRKHIQSAAQPQRPLSRELLRNGKGRDITLPMNSDTFMKKLADLASSKTASQFEVELALNNAFIQHTNISPAMKEALERKSQQLKSAIRFEQLTSKRAGCYSYARNDINDAANDLDPDPRKNLMLNFKKALMSTLSHELGHAFGLLHNFKASTDKANYEFPEQHTGRNYSSIMDYIGDIDMNYAGPGPYDLHAVRAAYTGMVEISKDAEGSDMSKEIPVSQDKLAKMSDIRRYARISSDNQLTKDSINKLGVLKYYEQCDDTEVRDSAMCARFDVGGSATEIVQNYIQDYNRGYLSRNYVHDKIVFDIPQKVAMIQRNIMLFQNIRSFLDETVKSVINNPGLRSAQIDALLADQVTAAKTGYNFFHEIIRTPTIPASVMRPVKQDDSEQAKKDKENDTNGDGLVINDDRFLVAPYKYTNAKGEEVEEFKLIEARSLFDIQLNAGRAENIDGEDTAGDRHKMDTIGISYDKVFSVMFLLQSTAAESKDDSPKSKISYVDFEQWFMGISEPTESPIMSTIYDMLSKNLKVGFFNPKGGIRDANMVEVPVDVQVSRTLGNQTALGAIIGLEENRFSNFDAFAEMFKVSKAGEKNAPRDRMNVVKAGQTRGLSDTKVYFAGQNGVGSDMLVNTAARNQFFTANKTALHNVMKQLHIADSIYRSAIAKKKADACKDDLADSDGCKAAKAKKDEEYIAEDEDLKKSKDAADAIANTFIAKLREANANGLILDKEMDAADSPINFEIQVTVLRAMLVSQIDVIKQALGMLEAAKTPADFNQTAGMIINALRKLKQQNARFENVQLLASGFNYVGELSKTLKVATVNGEMTGDIISSRMMNTTKIEDALDLQLDVIDKLSMLTGVVDPDTVLQ
ncbi:MAG: hypothetical protein K0R29_1846 [Pseudobdellovibrio sp.]|jgi:hypothetical protein|nr:hypothetical protein [Pseudobdellovibrio sp.]